MDVRNRRGTDIGSDHHLMIARIRIKISAAKAKGETQEKRFDVQKLQNKKHCKKFLELKKVRNPSITRGREHRGALDKS